MGLRGSIRGGAALQMECEGFSRHTVIHFLSASGFEVGRMEGWRTEGWREDGGREDGGMEGGWREREREMVESGRGMG